ncbi:MAG: GNAT family N-acetyltransferase [Candidatus Odinarchaeota archaeon]
MIQPSEDSGFINLVYSTEPTNKDTNEKKLFDFAFKRIRDSCKIICLMNPLISSNLSDHMIRYGFQVFDRAKLSIDRKTIENLDEPEFPREYDFVGWSSDIHHSLVELIANFHLNGDIHIDGKVFPHWCGFDGSDKLLVRIENNVYGRFDANHARILRYNGKSIGTCIITVLPSNIGYIPEIVVSQHYQRKGLGAKLLIHSLKHFIEDESDIASVELDVTLSNSKAKNLYTSLGFKPLNKYSWYVWTDQR